ncbi:Transglutaminase-like enzyme, putative cysteine protease [Minicystis rosea]|nr:Transglutaminase-like enzyme, putative cysteine protease [Minicystis rosea]
MRALAPVLAISAAFLVSRPARADVPPPPSTSWATTQAAELARQARDHTARGEAETAVARYVEAIRLDPTYATAYLGLAALYEARGDTREAERTYAVGLDHVPGFADALTARGRLRAKLRRTDEAIADLEAAASIAPDALPVLRDLCAAYVTVRALPAALAVSRRMAALAEAQADTATAAEAKVRVKALTLLVAEVDPVTAGRSGRGPVRNALAMMGRRR